MDPETWSEKFYKRFLAVTLGFGFAAWFAVTHALIHLVCKHRLP